jgi:acylphosphatase
MKTAHVVISGFVQGIGFRHFVRQNAQKLGLKGWVRNIPGGNVEAVFQGSKDAIDEMILLCQKGPMFSEVKEVTIDRIDSEEQLEGFEIVI